MKNELIACNRKSSEHPAIESPATELPAIEPTFREPKSLGRMELAIGMVVVAFTLAALILTNLVG